MKSLFANLDTPVAIVDRQIMDNNIKQMQRRMDDLGVKFRPHAKTSKSVDVIKAQMEAGASGITVATIAEAQMFFEQGISDIIYAIGITPNKLKKVLALRKKGCLLKVVTDSLASATNIAEFGKLHGEAFEVLIEIDSDDHRCGVKAGSFELIEIAKVLTDNGMTLSGVMTHAGSSYEFDTPEPIIALAEQERKLIVQAAEELRKAGFDCPIVSLGSTPTAIYAEHLEGVTEVRAGTYVFFDLFQRNVGVCSEADIALTVLTTVISHQVEKGWVIVDAGWMAMSRDRGTVRQKKDYAYGQVCNIEGKEVEGFLLTGTNQDHGVIEYQQGDFEGDVTELFPVGSQLRIMPNHCCATGSQYCEYFVVDDGQLKVWPRMQGMPKQSDTNTWDSFFSNENKVSNDFMTKSS